MNHEQMRSFVLTALLVALVLLLGMTPIGMIPLGFINISLLGVPVVIGTLLLGLKTGLLLGACFGTVSALSAFGIYGTPSALAGALVAASPVLALVMCFLPRLLVPVVAQLVYRAASRSCASKAGGRRAVGAVSLAAVCGSLTNTLMYLGLMLLFYVIMGIDSARVLSLIGGTGLIAGSLEAVANALVSTAVLSALRKLRREG